MLRHELVKEIQAKVATISTRTSEPDPGYAGPSATVARQINSAIIFEGHVIHRAIQLHLAATARYRVLRNVRLPLSRDVRVLAEVNADGDVNADGAASELRANHTGSCVSVDLLVFDRITHAAGFYDVKRGHRNLGANHRRQLVSNHAAIRMQGRSVAGRLLDVPVTQVTTGLLSYYGATTAEPVPTHAGAQIDACFASGVVSEIAAHLSFQRYLVGERIPGAVGNAYKLRPQ